MSVDGIILLLYYGDIVGITIVNIMLKTKYDRTTVEIGMRLVRFFLLLTGRGDVDVSFAVGLIMSVLVYVCLGFFFYLRPI